MERSFEDSRKQSSFYCTDARNEANRYIPELRLPVLGQVAIAGAIVYLGDVLRSIVKSV